MWLPFHPLDNIVLLKYSFMNHRVIWFFLATMVLLMYFVVPIQASESFSYVIKHLPSTNRDDKFDIPPLWRKPVESSIYEFEQNQKDRSFRTFVSSYQVGDGRIASVFHDGRHGDMPPNMAWKDGIIEISTPESVESGGGDDATDDS